MEQNILFFSIHDAIYLPKKQYNDAKIIFNNELRKYILESKKHVFYKVGRR